MTNILLSMDSHDYRCILFQTTRDQSVFYSQVVEIWMLDIDDKCLTLQVNSIVGKGRDFLIESFLLYFIFSIIIYYFCYY